MCPLFSGVSVINTATNTVVTTIPLAVFLVVIAPNEVVYLITQDAVAAMAYTNTVNGGSDLVI
jgi:hypothetical protein